MASALPLPDSFLCFLEENGLDPSIYSIESSIPRYIRLKPGCEIELSSLEEELGCNLEGVVWLKGFFAIPPHVRISGSDAYRNGKIYGMDAASGAAVLALNVLPGDHVLDLCAAPGAKLCMISDLLGGLGTVTGVDVIRHRLTSCRTIVLKYSLGDCCRLFLADGTSFSVPPPASSDTQLSQSAESAEVFEGWSSKRTRRERRMARKSMVAPPTDEPELIFYGRSAGVVGRRREEIFRSLTDVDISGYDKVLVDSECTHDGSVKHLRKFDQWGWDTLQRRVLDASRTDGLDQLQLKLLSNGFRLLKTGGSLVYSTCSLTVTQNEDVVRRFLAENSSAELKDVEWAEDWPCTSGKIPKTLRFDPATSRTSGLFIAKITKRASHHDKS
ncbi:S-adenosyl-L-methionine-dependent methyltransferases superfamily protein [Wolffia australiana]